MSTNRQRRAASASLLAIVLGAALAAPALAQSPAATGAPSPGPLALLALGNSLPGGMGCAAPCRPYPELVGEAASAALGRPVSVTNLATNDGLGSGTLLERVTTDQVHRDAIAGADIITLQIGRNDWFDGCYAPNLESCLTAGEQKVAGNLDAILTEIDTLRAGKPTAVRVLDYYNAEAGDPNLPGDWTFDDTPEATAAFMAAYDPLLMRFDDTICRVATEHDAVCVDLMAAFNGPDGTASAEPYVQLPDHVHPNAAGAALITQRIAASGFAPLD